MNVLLVEDNISIIKGLAYSFEKNKLNLVAKTNIKESKEFLSINKDIDLIILDITLPDGNGFDLYNDILRIVNNKFL